MEETTDINRELMLDANATAGLLYEIFGPEMTAANRMCLLRQRREIGALLAFTHGPGIVLRCSACENVVLRIVQTPMQSIWMRAAQCTCGSPRIRLCLRMTLQAGEELINGKLFKQITCR